MNKVATTTWASVAVLTVIILAAILLVQGGR